MTDLDLERLGDVWRQPPDPEELEALKRSAERVSRQARRGQIADFALAIVVSGVLLVLAMSNPKPATLLMAGAAILFMLISTVRQRKLRELEVRSLSGTAEEMLDQSVSRTNATLKRLWIGLIGSPAALLLGGGFAWALTGRDVGENLERWTTASPLHAAIPVLIFIAFILVDVRVVRQIRATKIELERLQALRESYRREGEAADRLQPKE